MADKINIPENTVPAEHFCRFLQVNVDNDLLSDYQFRGMVRRTLPIVIFEKKGIFVDSKG